MADIHYPQTLDDSLKYDSAMQLKAHNVIEQGNNPYPSVILPLMPGLPVSVHASYLSLPKMVMWLEQSCLTGPKAKSEMGRRSMHMPIFATVYSQPEEPNQNLKYPNYLFVNNRGIHSAYFSALQSNGKLLDNTKQNFLKTTFNN